MDIKTAITTFILGGGFLAFLQFLIERYDKKKDAIKELKEYVVKMEKTLGDKIDSIEAKAAERNAVSARVRILRFADEIAEGRKHSKESFDQCLSDIDEYEDYCAANPTFQNNKTVTTAAYIKRIYAERLEKHDFL